MLPVNSGGHPAYQNFVTENLRKYYPDPCPFSRSTWDIIERFFALDLSFTDEFLRNKYSVFGPKPRTPSCMQRSYLLSIDFKVDSITDWISIAGDGTPFVTSAQQRKHHICDCADKGIMNCNCDQYFSQPDCDIGWDSSRGRFYNGYDLYMLVAADSESDLPIFPLLNPASKHDSHAFLETYFRMKSFLSGYHVSKWILDAAHDAMPYYTYCHKNHIQPFIDLNEKRGIHVKYKDDFTIGKDGIPVCQAGRKMNHDGSEPSKARLKFRCPLSSRKYGCSCEHPCSDSKYGRTVHLAMKDNPRLINFPPRDSEEWKKEFNARTSVERSNKREKIDFKLESGRHRSSKMWYCRLYHILKLQHMDACNMPYESAL